MPDEAPRPADELRPDAVALTRWAAQRLGGGALRPRDVSWDHAEAHVLALAPSGDARFEAWGREILGRVGATRA